MRNCLALPFSPYWTNLSGNDKIMWGNKEISDFMVDFLLLFANGSSIVLLVIFRKRYLYDVDENLWVWPKECMFVMLQDVSSARFHDILKYTQLDAKSMYTICIFRVLHSLRNPRSGLDIRLISGGYP